MPVVHHRLPVVARLFRRGHGVELNDSTLGVGHPRRVDPGTDVRYRSKLAKVGVYPLWLVFIRGNLLQDRAGAARTQNAQRKIY